jgi:hypothetical protein
MLASPVIALEGQIVAKPGDHAAGEVHGVESLFLKERGRAQRATSGATGADNQAISRELVEMVGQFGQGNQRRHRGVTGVPLVLLTHVNEDGVAFQ